MLLSSKSSGDADALRRDAENLAWLERAVPKFRNLAPQMYDICCYVDYRIRRRLHTLLAFDPFEFGLAGPVVVAFFFPFFAFAILALAPFTPVFFFALVAPVSALEPASALAPIFTRSAS